MRFSVLIVVLLIGHSVAAQTPADTLDFSDVTPEIIGGLAALQQNIVYPDADRAAGRQGTVILRFVVTAEGEAAAVQVARSVSPGLDAAAVAGVRAARFVPGRENGQPVNVRIALPIRFTLAGPEPRRGLDADTLLGRLGLPWSPAGLPAPDATVIGDRERRLVWRAPDAETEQITAEIVRDTLRVLAVTARPGAPALVSLRRLAAAIDAERVRADADGFYTADELGINGVPSRFDVAFDLAARSWRFRAPPCPLHEAVACQESPPVLLGGIRAFERGIQYPRFAAETETSGTVVARFEVGTDGQVSDVTLDGEPSGLPEATLRQAALRAVAASRWSPATAGGRPVAVRMSLPLRFRVLQDWRD
ncbi:MAG TPA: energy transducer TonB [Rubricoccaceae bacterium]|jgi:TonB family protein